MYLNSSGHLPELQKDRVIVQRIFANREQCYRRQKANPCHLVVPISDLVINSTPSVMARLHALVADPTIRYVRMGSRRNPLKQSFDQGELSLQAYRFSRRQSFLLTIYSYVQMLERQQAQLIAGLQEFYRRTQNGEGWTGPRLELGNHNQPLTHKVLEALGVLHPDEWEDARSDDSCRQSFEKHGPDEDGWMISEPGSPSTQATLSPSSPPLTAFPQSTIMSKRQSKLQTGLAPMAQCLLIPAPLMTNFACIKPEPYNYASLRQVPITSDAFQTNEQTNMGVLGSSVDWSLGMDDLFDNLSGQEQSMQGC